MPTNTQKRRIRRKKRNNLLKKCIQSQQQSYFKFYCPFHKYVHERKLICGYWGDSAIVNLENGQVISWTM